MNELEPKRPKKLRPILVLAIATVLLYVAVIGMAVLNFRTGQTNRGVLCALKAELERDIKNSRVFLQENPDGIPGIPADLIRRGIEEDRQTLVAFDGLDCPSE